MTISEFAKKALDQFATATGVRLIPDPLQHPGGENDCTLKIAGYRQIESYTCGFTVGAMMLHTFHPGACLDAFFDQCNPCRERGLETGRLVRCLRANGVGVSVKKDLTFDKIVETIDQGYPIITLTKTSDVDEIHWVVLYGYGTNPNRVFMAGEGLPVISAVRGQKEILWAEFSRSKWADRGFGLVCWGK